MYRNIIMGSIINKCCEVCDCDCLGSQRRKVTARDIITDVKQFTEDELDDLKGYMIRHDPYLFAGQGCLGGCC